MLDTFLEIANIGTGHAATALSRLMNDEELRVYVPKVMILPFEELQAVIGAPEQKVVGVYIRVSGDVVGHVSYMMSMESGLELVRKVGGKDVNEFDEMGYSILQEVGNIVVTNYLNAIGNTTGLLLMPSVPSIAIDMAGAIWISVLASAHVLEDVTLTKTQYFSESTTIDGDILFLPNEESFAKLVSSLMSLA